MSDDSQDSREDTGWGCRRTGDIPVVSKQNKVSILVGLCR